jgi:hypothetical protein
MLPTLLALALAAGPQGAKWLDVRDTRDARDLRTCRVTPGVLLRLLDTGYSYTEASGAALACTAPVDQSVSVARASTRTCTEADGTIVTLAANQPCVAGSPLALDVFPATTNNVLQSEAADTAAWTKDAAAVTADSASAPDGANTADMVTASAGAGEHRLYQSVTLATGYNTWSVYAKAGAVINYMSLSAEGGLHRAIFKLSPCSFVSSTSVFTNNAVAGPNGWCRFSMTFNVTNAAQDFSIKLASSALTAQPGTAWTAAGTETAYVWGAQLETSGGAGRYVSTTSAPAQSSGDSIYTAWPMTNADSWSMSATYCPLIANTISSGNQLLGVTDSAGGGDRFRWSVDGSGVGIRCATHPVSTYHFSPSMSANVVGGQCYKLVATWSASARSATCSVYNASSGALIVSGTTAADASGFTDVAGGRLYMNDPGSSSYPNGTVSNICVGKAGACQ